jgi:hypothetical protein
VIRLQIRVDGAARLRNRAARGETVYDLPTREAIQAILNGVRKEAQARAPRDTGRLQRSLKVKVDNRPVPRFGTVYSSLPYARAVHDGRRAGARMPPPGALAGWAGRHGFTGSLFVLARSIGRKGIAGRPFLRTAARNAKGRMDAELRRAAKKIEARWKAGK